MSPKICCLFENLSVDYFTLTALHSADKFSNEQQILRLKKVRDFEAVRDHVVGAVLSPKVITKKQKRNTKKMYKMSEAIMMKPLIFFL